MLMTNYNIGSTTSNVQVGSRTLAIYGNTYTEMEFTAVGPTAVSFVYRHMDSSYVLLRNQATAVTLIHAGGYACVDLETGNVVANPSSTGTEWCYNNLGFFNPYDTLGPRGIFILQY